MRPSVRGGCAGRWALGSARAWASTSPCQAVAFRAEGKSTAEQWKPKYWQTREVWAFALEGATTHGSSGVCGTTERVELLLPTDPRSAAAAREFVRASGCPAHDLEVLDEALLLISELVTNSVKYGGAPILLAIECDEQTLNIRVRDGSSAAPSLRVASENDESGRGLALVDLLSDAWGVDPVDDEHGTGKAVWFRLRGAG